MSIASGQVVLEYDPPFTHGGQLSLYISLLVGALFWGITADIIGRKFAFNFSLLISAVFAIAAGGASSYVGWCSLVGGVRTRTEWVLLEAASLEVRPIEGARTRDGWRAARLGLPLQELAMVTIEAASVVLPFAQGGRESLQTKDPRAPRCHC